MGKARAPTRLLRAGALLVLPMACQQAPAAPPPIGEVLVFADTDLSVPRLVNRLRIDVYAADGTWYASHDLDRSHAGDWPASFAVSLADGAGEQLALVRLRAYAAGYVRDYRGERFLERPMGSTDTDRLVALQPFATDCPDCPRLVDAAGQDVTPPTEPLPLLAVDRLVLVRVQPGVVRSARVLLRGECVGTMADLYGLADGVPRTCTDTEGQLEDVAEEPLDADTTAPASSLQNAFEAQFTGGCAQPPRAPGTAPDGTPLYDEEVCVPGGVFVLGSEDEAGYGSVDDFPQRLAAVPAFRMERYEVTVARWRDALARGFRSPDASPQPNDAPLPMPPVDESTQQLCTWSDAPRPGGQDREAHGVNCVSWVAARAFCRFEGGDLPTEAQWEYAAAAAGRPFKTRYAWAGPDDAAPGCDRAVFGRGDRTGTDDACASPTAPFGPASVTAADHADGDRTPPMWGGGAPIVDLGGNYSEWTADTAAPLDSACWLGSSNVMPSCESTQPAGRSVRGGAWFDTVVSLAAATRLSDPAAGGSANDVGFRCVRVGDGP